jgi:hypothetical protein
MTVFSWDSFAGLAIQMLEFSWDRPVREAALRSAVSRAYYAAFHCARLRAEAEGESIPEKGEAPCLTG